MKPRLPKVDARIRRDARRALADLDEYTATNYAEMVFFEKITGKARKLLERLALTFEPPRA